MMKVLKYVIMLLLVACVMASIMMALIIGKMITETENILRSETPFPIEV